MSGFIQFSFKSAGANEKIDVTCVCVRSCVSASCIVSENLQALSEKLASPSLTHSYRCQRKVGIKLL